MRKNFKDGKVLSALTVGIAAMMALAAPITAYAEGEEAPTPEDDQTPATQETASEVAQTEPVETKEAQEQAEKTETVVEQIAEAVAPIVSEESGVSESDGGAVAEAAVEEVASAVEAVQEVVQEVQVQVQEAEQNLEKAETKLVQEKEAAKEVVENVQEAEKVVERTEATVEEAKTTVENAVEKINEAAASENKAEAKETVEKAYEEITKKVEETTQTVETQQIYLNQLKDDYELAKKALYDAKKDFMQAVNDASIDAGQAKAKLEEAQEKVDDLKEAVENAQEKLDYENDAANDLSAKLEINSKDGANWDRQAEVLKSYVRDYYIPQVLGVDDVENITFVKKVKGIDRQDYTYYEFSYTDKDGNSVTKYFNLDRVDKRAVAGDPYAGVGNKNDIVIFEKSEEEAKADAHLRSLYSSYPWFKNGVEKGIGSDFEIVKNKMRAGDFRVYAYTENGVVKFISQEQVTGVIEDSRKVVVAEDGTITVDGIAAHEVIQNINNNVHEKNVIINTKEGDEAMEQFIEHAQEFVDQYKEYTDAVNTAEQKTAEAKEEARKLEEAINDLKNQDNSVVSAAKALGVKDVAAFLKIEVSEEEADKLNKMTIDEVIGYLDNLLADANKRMEDAVDTLEKLKDQKEEAKKVLDELAKVADINSEEVIDFIENKEKKDNKENKQDNEAAAAERNDNAVAAYDGDILDDETAATFDPGTPIYVTFANPVIETIPDVMGVLREGLEVAENAPSVVEMVNTIAEEKESEDIAEVAGVVNNTIEETPSKIVNIEDEETPLSATIPVEEATHMNWWWLLLVILLGATGEEIYKRYKEEIAEQKVEN